VTGPGDGPAAGDALTRTQLVEFSARSAFHFQQHNTGPRALQRGRAGERHYTSSEPFTNQVLARQPKQFTIHDTDKRLPCLPRQAWAGTDYAGKRVLFLLPSEALGNNVSTLLFLQAFVERCRPAAVGVFCARSTADIYLRNADITVYPLWLGQRDLKTWPLVIDLGQLESRRNIDIWPVDMEADLLAAFAIPPSRRYAAAARPCRPQGRPKLGLLPLASSPLRTLPPSVTLALAAALVPLGEVTICLNRNQRQGLLYAQAIAGKLPQGVGVVDAFATIDDLLTAIDRFDYAVFADSGPAHMSKLFATPGLAVYSSAPGDILQGRFENLRRWTIPFKGPHCAAPCGLAKVRKTADGRVGCMGSLGVELAALPGVPGRGDAEVVERLQREPVPCLAELARDPTALVATVVADLRARLENG